MAELLDLLTEADQAIIVQAPATETEQERDKRFERACEVFQNGRIEMDEAGNIFVTPGNSDDSSYRSGEAFFQLAAWARKDGTGRAFDSSSVFNLPSGAKRQPDAAWVPKAVLAREGSFKLKTVASTRHVPVFLIEVTSPSSNLSAQQDKCRKWIQNGVEEAFLIHPKTRTVYVFRLPGSMIEIPEAKKVASSILPGFVLDCGPLWEDLY
jgi:Uma2 family endonuclease